MCGSSKWYWKLAYVVGAYAVGVVILAILPGAFSPGHAILISVLDIASILYGARVFRGKDELLTVSRPWWQMTSRKRLSWVFGWIAAFFAVYVPIVTAAGFTDRRGHALWPGPLSASIAQSVEVAVIGFLYLNSGVRLSRQARVRANARYWQEKRMEPGPGA